MPVVMIGGAWAKRGGSAREECMTSNNNQEQESDDELLGHICQWSWCDSVKNTCSHVITKVHFLSVLRFYQIITKKNFTLFI